MSPTGEKLLDAAIVLGRITATELETLGIEFDPEEVQRVAAELRRIGFLYVQRIAAETEARETRPKIDPDEHGSAR